MKKYNLLLVMAAFTLGSLLNGCQKSPKNPTAAEEIMTPQMQDFYNNLSTSAQKKFDQLDNAHKKKAFEKASSSNTKDPNKVVDTEYNDQMSGKPSSDWDTNTNPNQQNQY